MRAADQLKVEGGGRSGDREAERDLILKALICPTAQIESCFNANLLSIRLFSAALERAAKLCAQGLETGFAQVLEFMPDEKRLLVRAGVGWAPGALGHVSLGIELESPAGFAFHTGQTVISNHLLEETRFRTPKLLSDHAIKRAINVLIARGGEGHLPFGILEADTLTRGQFDVADADFLAGFAGLLGIAIERQHADADLKDALEHQAMLTREMSHRVKNSLAGANCFAPALARTCKFNAKSRQESSVIRRSYTDRLTVWRVGYGTTAG